MDRCKKVAAVPSLLFLALFICAAAIANYGQSAPATRSNSDCNEVKGAGHTVGKSPSNLEGTVDVVINNETRSAKFSAELFDPIVPPNDKPRQVTMSHHFVFGDGGSFTTSGKVSLMPTGTPGLYNLNSVSKIVGGTGSYRNASGEILLSGTINLNHPEANWSIRGQICVTGE